jgi:hypothetical protein
MTTGREKRQEIFNKSLTRRLGEMGVVEKNTAEGSKNGKCVGCAANLPFNKVVEGGWVKCEYCATPNRVS